MPFAARGLRPPASHFVGASSISLASADGESSTIPLPLLSPQNPLTLGFCGGRACPGSHACRPRSRRVKVRSAPFPPTGRRKLRPLPCPSSPHANRLAGFARGPHSSRRTCRREKRISLYSRLRARTLRGFFDKLDCRPPGRQSYFPPLWIPLSEANLKEIFIFHLSLFSDFLIG